MGITQENFDKAFDVLTERSPEYQIAIHINSITGEDYGYALYFKKIRGSEAFSEIIHESVEEMIFKLQKQKALNEISDDYLRILIHEIEKTIDTFKELNVRRKNFYFQLSTIIYLHEPERKYYTIENVDEQYFNQIVKISQTRFDFCKIFKASVEKILNTSPTQKTNKLKLNLSVSEITLLFRLLDENKLLDYRHKTEIYKFISNSFKTEKQSNISESSIKNKFLSPDNKALDNMNYTLTNLKIALKKLHQKE